MPDSRDANPEKNISDCEDCVDAVREWPTCRPLFWFDLPEGPKREVLRAEQEKSGYVYPNHRLGWPILLGTTR